MRVTGIATVLIVAAVIGTLIYRERRRNVTRSQEPENSGPPVPGPDCTGWQAARGTPTDETPRSPEV
jgi:hypothetical protein